MCLVSVVLISGFYFRQGRLTPLVPSRAAVLRSDGTSRFLGVPSDVGTRTFFTEYLCIPNLVNYVVFLLPDPS